MRKLKRMVHTVARPLLLLALAGASVRMTRLSFLYAVHAHLIARPDLVRVLSALALNTVIVGVVLLLAAYALAASGGEGSPGQLAARLVPVERQGRRRRVGRRQPVEPGDGDTEHPGSVRELVGALLRNDRRVPPRVQGLLLRWLGTVWVVCGVLGSMFLVGPPAVKLLVLVMTVAGAVWGLQALFR